MASDHMFWTRPMPRLSRVDQRERKVRSPQLDWYINKFVNTADADVFRRELVCFDGWARTLRQIGPIAHED
jgi:hypothetical protein